MLTKSSIIILIGICVIVIASILSYAVFIKPEPVIPVQPIVNNDASPVTTPNDISEIDNSGWEEIDYSEKIDILNWNTYRNNEYGYEISYPKDWKLAGENENITLISPQTLKMIEEQKAMFGGEDYGPFANDITIYYYSSVEDEYVNKTNKLGATTIDELIKKNVALMKKIGKIKIDNQNATEVIEHGEAAYYIIFIENNGHLYKIMFNNRWNKEELSGIEKRILSTFKFINS